MKKVLIFALLSVLLLTGCACEHTWSQADCTTPASCQLCGEAEGQPLGHDWAEATCDMPQVCTRCGEEQGEPAGHDWAEATCDLPQVCTRCGEEQGEPAGHDWAEATVYNPKICRVCKGEEGTCLPRFDDDEMFLSCDDFYSLLREAVEKEDYVELEWGGERPQEPFRNFEFFDKSGPAIGLTLTVAYDPGTDMVTHMNFMYDLTAAGEDDVELYKHIAQIAYGVLSPDGLDSDLQLYMKEAMEGYGGILIIPINAQV